MFGRLTPRVWPRLVLGAALFGVISAPVFASKLEQQATHSVFRGKVFTSDGRPAEGVKILAYHLATAELFTTTTDLKAEFELTDLPSGYFDIAALSADGLYVADQVANIVPAGKNVIQVRLQEFGPGTENDRRLFPGSEETPTGVAQVLDRQMIDGNFWRSKRGIAVIGGGGALALLLAGGGSPPASPFIP